MTSTDKLTEEKIMSYSSTTSFPSPLSPPPSYILPILLLPPSPLACPLTSQSMKKAYRRMIPAVVKK